jgi:Sec-independent protein translocase protein TatA
MELFGIGPLELLLILLLALIIFGPKDIEKAGRTLGRSLYKLINSETWRSLTQVSKKMKSLPDTLIREAGLEELEKKKAAGKFTSTAWLEDPNIRPQTKPATKSNPGGDPPAAEKSPDE